MCDRITTLETHLRILSTLAPYAAVNFIRKGMGYEQYLIEYAQYRKIRPEELLEVLDRIQESAKGMKTLEEWKNYIEDYTKKLAEQAKKQETKREGIVISTLHAVKGLEYDKVYIMNVNEGSIPYKKSCSGRVLGRRTPAFLCRHDPGEERTYALLCAPSVR